MTTFPQIEKSRLRQKLLGYYFANPQANLYLREASGVLKEDPGNLSKELSRLEQAGIFLSISRGAQKYFTLNKSYPFYKELKTIVDKTVGVEGALKELVLNSKEIKSAFIYGSFARNKEHQFSDIDLFIIGSADNDDFMAQVESLESRLGREINYNIYSAAEFKERLRKNDSFLENIMKARKIILKGNPNAI